MLFLLDMLVCCCRNFFFLILSHKKNYLYCNNIYVDAGKSTIGGQIMSLTGMVDKRTLEKYEREAREKSRESWYLSWALDTNQEGMLHSIIIHSYVN